MRKYAKDASHAACHDIKDIRIDSRPYGALDFKLQSLIMCIWKQSCFFDNGAHVACSTYLPSDVNILHQGGRSGGAVVVARPSLIS
jgi:hypothetical protein